MLLPWLPTYVASGTGMIVDAEPASILFAFGSDLTAKALPGENGADDEPSSSDADADLHRMLDVLAELKQEGTLVDPSGPRVASLLPCPISALCVVNRGCWTYVPKQPGQDYEGWSRIRRVPADLSEVAALSDSSPIPALTITSAVKVGTLGSFLRAELGSTSSNRVTGRR